MRDAVSRHAQSEHESSERAAASAQKDPLRRPAEHKRRVAVEAGPAAYGATSAGQYARWLNCAFEWDMHCFLWAIA